MNLNYILQDNESVKVLNKNCNIQFKINDVFFLMYKEK